MTEAVRQVGNFLIWSTLAGGLGAVAMAAVLWAFTESGLAKVRLIIAMGSLLTRGYERAALVGCFLHAVAGIFFGQIYTFLLLAIGHPGVGVNMMWGAAFGMLHGIIMAIVLVAVAAEVHPLPEFQQRGFTIAITHWVAHMIYGLVVGAVIGMSGIVAPQYS